MKALNGLFADLLGKLLKKLAEGFVEELDAGSELQDRVLDPLKEWVEKKWNINL